MSDVSATTTRDAVKPLTFGSLFAGIGGMDRGLERSGMTCKWQVELDPWARRVLAKHWPDVPKHGDIREITGDELEPVDLICGGPPCQDLSRANRGRQGLAGARSGLWTEFARLIRRLRPRYVLVENVPDLLTPIPGVAGAAPFATFLGDLAALGFDAQWELLPASAVGAPHLRERVWLVAYPCGLGLERLHRIGQSARDAGGGGDEAPARVGDPGTTHWLSEPRIRRVAARLPQGMDRLRGIGNAVVPQIPELLGRWILEAEERLNCRKGAGDDYLG